MEMTKLLNKEIENEFEKLEMMDVGSEQYKVTVDGLTKLVDRAVEIEKFEIEREDKIEQVEEEKLDRRIKNIIAMAGIAIPSLITIWGTLKSLKFEETGAVTTNAGREFFKRLFHKK